MIPKIMLDDFEYIKKQNIYFNKLNNKNILITGATGYIGSFIVHFLNYLMEKTNLKINIILLVRNIEKAKNMFKSYDVKIYEGNIQNKINIPLNIDYILHCAAITKSKLMVEYPDIVYNILVEGTKNIVDFAVNKNIESMIYLSSMEVYGAMEGVATEEKLGYIDDKEPRSSYPLGKRKAEEICISYYKKYNVPVKIARLAQTFGTGIPLSDNRVFAQFAKSAINEKDIVLHTKGTSIGNYCYIADTVYALFILLLEGKNGEIYNVVNEKNTMSIRDMAKIVSEISKYKSKVIFDIPEENIFGYAAETHMKLSGKKISEIGFIPHYNMISTYERLIKYLLSF